jgi:two-component system C4-dicarboxylate transport sensor histidine kinase DctB
MAPRRILWGLLGLLLVSLATLAALQWARTAARIQAEASGESLGQSHRGLLSSELQKFRLLPLVLVEYPDVGRSLSSQDEASRRRLDASLELLAARTGAAVIYAIDRQGRTVAASNWRLPSSFVGQYYRFRPYFGDAMRNGTAELFALGTVSGRPGLYLARRVDAPSGPVGVIVVKVEFDELEKSWARSPGATVVTDRNGIILITSVAEWRFRPTRPLAPAIIDDARRSLQFGRQPLRPPPFALTGGDARLGEEQYRVARLDAPLAGATLLHLSDLAGPRAAARSQAFTWLLALLLVGGLAGGFALRAADRRTMQRRARLALEQEVTRRTAELRDANARLAVESDERLDAERRFRAAREELAQANRLGSLGQITAGVAHEINQPMAAIRAFAENGRTFLARGSAEKVGENLAQIVALTERVGSITSELRAFSRRKAPAAGTATVRSVLNGLMLLIGEAGRGVVCVTIAEEDKDIAVAGDRIRLEQILVNLVQNALDATADVAEPRIVIDLEQRGDTSILLRICDNGAGVDPAIRQTLFTPFTSTKAEGLGLGLGIARDLAREFGGDLDHVARPEGTMFLLRLVRA